MRYCHRSERSHYRRIVGSLTTITALGLAMGGCTPATDDSENIASALHTSEDNISKIVQPEPTSKNTTLAATDAAEYFLSTLNKDEKTRVFSADTDGLDLNNLSNKQQAAALKIIKKVLNPDTYAMFTDLIGWDDFSGDEVNVLKSPLEHYSIAFLQPPAKDRNWALRIQGPQLDATVEINADGNIDISPIHINSEPESNPQFQPGPTTDLLKRIQQHIYALYRTFDEYQQQSIYQGTQIVPSTCSEAGTCANTPTTGINCSSLNPEQRKALITLASDWINNSDSEAAATIIAKLTENLNNTYIRSSGSLTYDPNSSEDFYLEISNPELEIEFIQRHIKLDEKNPEWFQIKTYYHFFPTDNPTSSN